MKNSNNFKIIATVCFMILTGCKLGQTSDFHVDGNTSDGIGNSSAAQKALLKIDHVSEFVFPATINGKSSENIFEMTNTGNSEAKGIQLSLQNGAFAFKGGSYPGTDGTCSSTLLPKTTCTFVVVFNPDQDTLLQSNITLTYFDGVNTATGAATLNGTGLAVFNKNIALDLNGDAFGSGHSCAVTMSKNLACWGWNDDGQLGLNDRLNRNKPELVLAGEQGGMLLSNVAKVAVGRDNTCALTLNGDVYCWGLGAFNGTGAVVTDALTPVRVLTGEQADISGFLSGVKTISMGYNFTCASTNIGDVYCWGNGGNGRLGYGGTASSNIPKKVVGGMQGGAHLTDVKSVDVGRATACAVTNAGDVLCWGDARGAGVNTTGNLLTPARTLSGAQGGDVFLKNVDQIGVGWNRTCALVTTGNVFCWGDGSSSSLGHGLMEQKLTPVKVLGGEQGGLYLENITQLSCGFNHACAISSSRELYCWGSNQTQLPGKILDISGQTITDAFSIAAGPVHSCYTRVNGDVYCWGSNTTGQIGSGAAPGYSTVVDKVVTELIEN